MSLERIHGNGGLAKYLTWVDQPTGRFGLNGMVYLEFVFLMRSSVLGGTL